MECPHRWTLVAVIIYLSFQDTGLCKNVVRESRDCVKTPGLPSSTDMLNSILTNAATSGILPDLIPMLQGQQIADHFHRYPYSQDMLTKPLSVVPMPSAMNAQEPIILSSQPIRSSANSLPCGSGCPSNIISAIPQTISPPALSPSNCLTQIAQALPLENYPACASNVGVVQPIPIVLQPQSQYSEANPYFYNQLSEPMLLSDVNLPTLSSGQLELTSNLGCPFLTQPIIFTSDGQQFPFQINVPTASVPAPRVTVVAANPSNSPVSVPLPSCPDYLVSPPSFQYPPQLPIILDGSSKSSLRNLLPIILVALFSDRGCNNGGGCCCCCSCNGGSGNNIPIPYPIPIPINNPIVNNYPHLCSSRNRENRDEGDDGDED